LGTFKNKLKKEECRRTGEAEAKKINSPVGIKKKSSEKAEIL